MDSRFCIRQAETKDIESALQSYRDGYRKEFGWFVATEANLQKKAQGFAESIKNGDVHWLIERAGVPLSYCHLSVNDYPARHYFGPTGGIERVLHPEIQGYGVGWFLYQESLKILKETGHRTYIENTAQSSVMKMGKALGRVRIATHFRKEGFLPWRILSFNGKLPWPSECLGQCQNVLLFCGFKISKGPFEVDHAKGTSGHKGFCPRFSHICLKSVLMGLKQCEQWIVVLLRQCCLRNLFWKLQK